MQKSVSNRLKKNNGQRQNQSLDDLKTNEELQLEKQMQEEEEIQENKVQKQKDQKRQNRIKRQQALGSQSSKSRVIDDDDDKEEEDLNYNIEDVQQNQLNKDKQTDAILGLLLKNKVNQKNAFDIPLPDCKDLTEFDDLDNQENGWKHISATLAGSAKIYGYRVDQVHKQTYQVLGGMVQSEMDDEQKQKELQIKQIAEQEGINDQNTIEQEIMKVRETQGYGGIKTVEKNIRNINVTKYDLEFDIDPLFSQTSAKFDEQGNKGLLLNNTNIDSQILVNITSNNVITIKNQELQEQAKNYKPQYSCFQDIGFDDEKNLINILHKKICPELMLFKQELKNNAKDLFNVSKIDMNLNQSRQKQSNLSNQDNDNNDTFINKNNITSTYDQMNQGNNFFGDDLDTYNQIDGLLGNQDDFFEDYNLDYMENPNGMQEDNENYDDEDQYGENYLEMDNENSNNFLGNLSQQEEKPQFTNSMIFGDDFDQNDSDDTTSQSNLTGNYSFLSISGQQNQLQSVTLLGSGNIGFGSKMLSDSKDNWMQPSEFILKKKNRLLDSTDRKTGTRNRKQKQKDNINFSDFSEKLSKENYFTSRRVQQYLDRYDQQQKDKKKKTQVKKLKKFNKSVYIQQRVREILKTDTSEEIYHTNLISIDHKINPLRFKMLYTVNNAHIHQIMVSEQGEQQNRYMTQQVDDIHTQNYNFDDNFEVQTGEINMSKQVLQQYQPKERNFNHKKKTIPIKELKQGIWHYLDQNIQNNIQDTSNNKLMTEEDGSGNIIDGDQNSQIQYLNILDQIPQLFGESSAKHITIQTAFLTLLHLANENDLQYDNNDDIDFTILKDKNSEKYQLNQNSLKIEQ